MNEQGRGTRSAVAGAQQTEVAVLAGGCFWGVEDILRDVPGVIDTDVGYTGGWLVNPTYDDTHDSKSGHAEAVRVTFDPVGAQLRGPARAVVLQAARPDHAQPPGQRHRDAVPLGDLSRRRPSRRSRRSG